MNKRNIIFGILIVTLVVFSSCCNGQSKDKKDKRHEKPRVEELFKTMDEDQDGKLSLEEVEGPLKNDFATVDTDGDGFLTIEEVEKGPKREAKEPKHQERN